MGKRARGKEESRINDPGTSQCPRRRRCTKLNTRGPNQGKKRSVGGTHTNAHRVVFSQSSAISTSSLSDPNPCDAALPIDDAPDISTSIATADGPGGCGCPAEAVARSSLSIAREVISSRARCRRATSGSWRSRLATLWPRSAPWPFATSFSHCGGGPLAPRYVHVPSASAAARTGNGVRPAPAPVVCVPVDVPASAAVCVAPAGAGFTRMVCCRSCANLISAARARACLSLSLASLLSARPCAVVPAPAPPAVVAVDAEPDPPPPAPPVPVPPLPPVRECSPPCP